MFKIKKNKVILFRYAQNRKKWSTSLQHLLKWRWENANKITKKRQSYITCMFVHSSPKKKKRERKRKLKGQSWSLRLIETWSWNTSLLCMCLSLQDQIIMRLKCYPGKSLKNKAPQAWKRANVAFSFIKRKNKNLWNPRRKKNLDIYCAESIQSQFDSDSWENSRIL